MQHHDIVSPAQIAVPILSVVIIIAALVFANISWFRRNGYGGPGGRTIVRCREGHLFTTIWIPGVSLKSFRFGMSRFQHCPVGNHWTFVFPVRASDLTDEERRIAASYLDSPMP